MGVADEDVEESRYHQRIFEVVDLLVALLALGAVPYVVLVEGDVDRILAFGLVIASAISPSVMRIRLLGEARRGHELVIIVAPVLDVVVQGDVVAWFFRYSSTVRFQSIQLPL